jgi:hypothetical protein
LGIVDVICSSHLPLSGQQSLQGALVDGQVQQIHHAHSKTIACRSKQDNFLLFRTNTIRHHDHAWHADIFDEDMPQGKHSCRDGLYNLPLADYYIYTCPRTPGISQLPSRLMGSLTSHINAIRIALESANWQSIAKTTRQQIAPAGSSCAAASLAAAAFLRFLGARFRSVLRGLTPAALNPGCAPSNASL